MRFAAAITVVAAGMLATVSRVDAAEGAFSHFLPGMAGDIAIAQSPKPGLQVANTVWIQTGNVGAAVLQGLVDLNLDTTTVLDIVVGSYTFETDFTRGTYTIAAAVPFGYAALDATIIGAGGTRIRASEDSFHLSDIFLIPVQLNWDTAYFSFKLAQAIIAPTGGYDLEEVVNLGRNYWSFDTVGAATWLSSKTGTEISIAPGIMFNTRNQDTDYKTGAEFHLDFTINQFLSETFAVGLRGYYYRQVTGDSGSGARLGDFESRSVGIGPGLFWRPKEAGGRLAFVGKWMHDLHAKYRFKSDYVTLAVAWTF
jgi:hypothetical protein